jgi:hypothetical protein
MPRLPRSLQWAREACYHLMDRGHDRQPIFADDTDRRAFLDLVARYRDRFGFAEKKRTVSGVTIASFKRAWAAGCSGSDMAASVP